MDCARRCAWVWTLRCCMTNAFTGLMLVQEPRTHMWRDWDSVLCAHVVMWAAELCACALVAWVTLGWAALVGMRDAGAWIGLVGAGRRFSRR